MNKKVLLSNNIIDILIINKIFYLKIKNLANIVEEEFNDIIFVYRYFNLICYNNKIKYTLIVDFCDTNVNALEFMGQINKIIMMLTYTKPITNHTIEFTLTLMNNEIIKNVINMILKVYNSGRPLFIISNIDDINRLLS